MRGTRNFVPAIRYCAAGLLLLFSTASGVTAQVNTTEKEVPVQIRLKPDKNSIMLGEPLFLARSCASALAATIETVLAGRTVLRS
jgi:hypothetical protein